LQPSEEALLEDKNEDEDAPNNDEQAIGATNNKRDIGAANDSRDAGVQKMDTAVGAKHTIENFDKVILLFG